MPEKHLPLDIMTWVDADIEDTLLEELEMEIDDQRSARSSMKNIDGSPVETLNRRSYLKSLLHLQTELVKLQDWVIHTNQKIVILFEGRDAAGKGGVIKRIVQRLNPRVCRMVALPAPSEREKSQWYFQRYVTHLPAGGEIVLFDRSWYNRAGVERVMGFATEDQVEEFFNDVPEPSDRRAWAPPSKASSSMASATARPSTGRPTISASRTFWS